jgi:hypothetical protein
MRSLDGELVPLTKKIRITTSVEEWLNQLSKEMVATLQQLLISALLESRKQIGQIPVEKYPSQVNIRFHSQFSDIMKNPLAQFQDICHSPSWAVSIMVYNGDACLRHLPWHIGNGL